MSPELIHQKSEYRARLHGWRQAGQRVGFVPTMGALHEGHLQLVDRARALGADRIAMSIFVNPMQFGPKEDLTKYPRTLPADLERCAERKVDVVFAPSPADMYPDGFDTKVTLEKLATRLEGEFRPGHFDGVATVVTKLLNLTGPCLAVFGQKDFQQLKVIERMALDLDLDTTIIAHPIVRENDGLAMSSRNRYLDAAARNNALGLVKSLRKVWDLWQSGERDVATLRSVVTKELSLFDAIDYIDFVVPGTLEPSLGLIKEPEVALLVTARIGGTRLLDNVVLGRDPRP